MNAIRFDEKVIVITGAGRGLGRCYALEFAARGAKVVVNDLGGSTMGEGNSSGPANETVAAITANGGSAVASFADISSETGGRGVVDTALDAFGRIDVVVNNAGIVAHYPFQETTNEIFERYWRVNFLGHVNVIRSAWPHFVAQGGGRIINTTSGASLYGMVDVAAYGASKGAIDSLTRTLALEGASAGVVVNAIGPAAFTRMQDEQVKDEAFRETAKKSMRAELVAPMVLLLAHDSTNVTGQIFEAFSGRVGRVITGEVPGYYDLGLTPESIRAHWDSVMGDANGLIVPRDAPSAAAILVEAAIRSCNSFLVD